MWNANTLLDVERTKNELINALFYGENKNGNYPLKLLDVSFKKRLGVNSEVVLSEGRYSAFCKIIRQKTSVCLIWQNTSNYADCAKCGRKYELTDCRLLNIILGPVSDIKESLKSWYNGKCLLRTAIIESEGKLTPDIRKCLLALVKLRHWVRQL